jgi:general secretion pathway protein L
MAQRVLGIDLGAHSVKIAELDVGFRSVKVLGLQTYPVLWQPGELMARSLAALPEQLGVKAQDIVTVGVPGDRVLLRMLDVPFTDPRKVQAVVGTELADDMPWEFEDVVYDHAMTRRPGKVLVAASRSDQVGELLEELTRRGVVPRQLAVAPLAYGGIVRRLHPDESVLVLDIGHARTNVCLVEEGRPLVGRTISRGGAQLTEALRSTFQLGHAEAEQFKHTRALVVANTSGLDAASARIAEVTALALAPLVREIRRSITMARGRAGATPQRVLLTGGTSLLSGLDTYLEAELGLPTSRLVLGQEADGALVNGGGLGEDGQAISALAITLGLGSGHRDELDFRQGEFAFKTDKSVFREKLFALATAVVLLLVFGTVSAYATMSGLRREEAVLDKQLRQATRRVLGRPISDPWKVSSTLKRGATSKNAGIPKMTAVDVLDLVSRHVPPGEEVKLDVNRVDIKPTKTYVKGTADSLSAVGNIVKALKKVDCFKEITSGKISEVSGGKKQFTLTISTKCF